jgi:hypothetical protein
MERRTVLRGIAGTASLTIAGCVTENEDSIDEPATASPSDSQPPQTDVTDTHPPTDAITPTQTLTPVTPNRITERSFSSGNSRCDSRQEGASVTWDRADSKVIIDGIIWGNNTCYTCELTKTPFDGDRLTIAVRAIERDEISDNSTCGECIVQIDYEVTVAFDRGLPSVVRVVHQRGEESRVVTAASF